MQLSSSENMSRFPSLEEQLDLITKGAAEIVPLEALKERIAKSIATGVPMRIKAGFDPRRRICIWGIRCCCGS
jgi:tyrosyl-tRNA synthetase